MKRATDLAPLTASEALFGLGLGLLAFHLAPPELKARIVEALRPRLSSSRRPLDLSGKHPGAIDVQPTRVRWTEKPVR